MPKENKKRGRRGGEKRKQDDLEDVPDNIDNGSSSKRRKSIDDGDEATEMVDVPETQDYIPLGDVEEPSAQPADDSHPPNERPFFGMLDDEEQEYFKQADDVLEANNFTEPEERTLFLANVYKEAEGKELKIAQSQGCSRLMERLIQVSDAAQLGSLFDKFAGNFIHLMSHRFASHCCEALFLKAGPLVTEEMKDAKKSPGEDGASKTLEAAFISTLQELDGNFGFLLTDRYASHVLRVLLLVLAGEPLDEASTQHLLKGKSKEKVTIQGRDKTEDKQLEESRKVPKSFDESLEQMIAGTVGGLDTDKLRALATHPIGSPTLQLLLQLELTKFGKQRGKEESSIIRTLLPDDPIVSECGSAQFISGIIYDATGSHLVEKIVVHAPGKTFRSLYKEFFKERLASFARNEISQYVVCRILERLGKDDLFDAHEMIVPTISNLLQRDRTIVIRTLIERCVARGIDTQAIAVAVEETWITPSGFDVSYLLKLETSIKLKDDMENKAATAPVEMTTEPRPKVAQAVKAHFNILAQVMLLVPGSLSSLVLESLTKLESETLVKIASDFIVSRTLQQALTTTNASMIARRKLIQLFYGNFGDMALDSAASHVVDCVWEGTHGLAFIRERIAEELAENEAELRNSPNGRAVWRNWKMDIYKRRRLDWIKQSKNKASNDGFQSFSELEVNKPEAERKTPLQIARERHMKKKAEKAKSTVEVPASGSNKITAA